MTQPPASNRSEAPFNDSDLSASVIIAIVGSSIVVALLVLLIVVHLKKRKRGIQGVFKYLQYTGQGLVLLRTYICLKFKEYGAEIDRTSKLSLRQKLLVKIK